MLINPFLMNAKLKKTYNYILRFAIILATYTFLYRQIFIKKKLGRSSFAFCRTNSFPRFYYWDFGRICPDVGKLVDRNLEVALPNQQARKGAIF